MSPLHANAYRTPIERQDLALHVESIDAFWHKDEGDLYNIVNGTLSLVTKLRQLRIHAAYHTQGATRYCPNFLLAQKQSHLEDVTIDYSSLSSADVCAFLQLPSLRSFRAYRICGPQIPPSDKTFQAAGHAISLGLGLYVRSTISQVLHRLLSLRSDTTKLSCALTLDWDDPLKARVPAPLSPRSLLGALAPVQHSLRKLDIIWHNGHWPGHDESRLSRCHFPQLAELTPSAVCFFHEPGPTPDRDSVFKLLPSSLISLRIDFELGIGFLREPSASDMIMKEQDFHIAESSTYHWLVQILDRKEEALPKLSRIENIERPWRLSSVDWQTPVKQLAECWERYTRNYFTLHRSLRLSMSSVGASPFS